MKKTAFMLPHSHFKFVSIVLGLWNTFGTFQCGMDAVLTAMKGQVAPPTLHGLVLFFSSRENHVITVRPVSSLLKHVGSKLNKKICNFFHDKLVISDI